MTNNHPINQLHNPDDLSIKQVHEEAFTDELDIADVDHLAKLESGLIKGDTSENGYQQSTSWLSDDAATAANTLKILRESLQQLPKNAIPFGIPRQLAQYELLELVGTGGFAMVFKAIDQNLARIVAVKIPKPHVVISDELHNKFLAEAKTAARLEHPRIVMTLEAGQDQDLPFIIYSFCEGPSLAQWLSEQAKPVEPVAAAQLVLHLAEGVEFSHQQGILHRDIKPANVLLFPRQEKIQVDSFPFIAKLTDFGLAKVTHAGLEDTSTSLVLGTPLYLAPEMISADEDHADSPAIDIYGLGLILYELLTLSPPFNDSRLITLLQKIQAETPKPLHRHDENIPVDLDTICQKCLRKNPVERYQSAAKLQEDLQNFIQGQQINASPPGSYEMFRAWAQHPMRIYEAGMLLIISTMGISVWMTLGIWLVMRLQAEGAKLEDLVVGCVQLICTINIPHIIGGIKIINGNRLWLYICMVICIFGFIISFCGVLGFTVAYPETYQYHPVARVLVFSMMSLLFLTQTFWLGIVTWGKHLPPAKT